MLNYFLSVQFQSAQSETFSMGKKSYSSWYIRFQCKSSQAHNSKRKINEQKRLIRSNVKCLLNWIFYSLCRLFSPTLYVCEHFLLVSKVRWHPRWGELSWLKKGVVLFEPRLSLFLFHRQYHLEHSTKCFLPINFLLRQSSRRVPLTFFRYSIFLPLIATFTHTHTHTRLH